MKAPISQAKASASKPETTDGLKTLPMPELEKRLGSPPNGLTMSCTSSGAARMVERFRTYWEAAEGQIRKERTAK